MVRAHGSRYVLRLVLPNRSRSIFQYGVEHTRLAHIRGIVLSRPHCPFPRLSCSLPSRASPVPTHPFPRSFRASFPAARRAHGTSGAFVSTQALLALALALLLLRSYISRQAAPGQAWSALVPWGCALYASQAGVAARVVVGRAGEVAIGEGEGGWADSAAASSTLQSEAAAATSEQRGAGSSGGEAGAAGGAGRLVEQQGPLIKEESAGAAGRGDQPADPAAVGGAAVGVTEGASTAVGALDGAIPTVDASNCSMSAGSNGSEAGGSSEAAEQAACEGAALTEEDVRARQAEEHAAFGRVQVEGGWEGKAEGKGVEGGQGGVAEAGVNEEVCFTVRALDANGSAFDNGCRQSAFLVALIALQRRQGSTDSRTDAQEGSVSNISGGSADVPVQSSARVTEVAVAVSGQARAAAGRAAVLLEEWEQRGEGGEGGQGEEGGGADVRMAARVTYHPGNSSHQVCVQLPLPGRYTLSLHLLFSATSLLLRSNARTAFDGGFSNYTVVHSQPIQAWAPPTFSLHAHRASLPYCTPPLLTASHHAGYWMGHLWQPHACRLRRLSPPALHACFHGRSLLFLGDSQLRYTFGFLRFLLRFPSRAAFLTKFAAKPKVFWPNMLACGSVPRGNGSIYPPVNSSTGELISTGVCQLPDSAFFFHGENFNGYGRAVYKVRGAEGSPPAAFNLTYASQCGAVKPVFPAWMSDPALVGPQLTLFDARDDAHNAAASSDARTVTLLGPWPDLLCFLPCPFHPESNLLPPLLAVMRDPSAVTVLGPWAAREDSKPPEFIPISNNARGTAFEAELLRWVGLLGASHASSYLSILHAVSTLFLLHPPGAPTQRSPRMILLLLLLPLPIPPPPPPPPSPLHPSSPPPLPLQSPLRRLPSTQPGAPSALGMMGLTLPRPDLCPDSTHYAWPVTLAILDLWLTPLCAAHASRS
ncbi:unnamed protein product [Closterium sp. Naga37s-1]|nr:unnamed protein product [Closterium sp. Naga37s-1]